MLSEKQRLKNEVKYWKDIYSNVAEQLAVKNQNIFAPYIKQYLEEHLSVALAGYIDNDNRLELKVQLVIDGVVISQDYA